MGIKHTDDYLTIRFANPETGLVSPSAYGDRTPRTPISPGHALSLHDVQTELCSAGDVLQHGRSPSHAQGATVRPLRRMWQAHVQRVTRRQIPWVQSHGDDSERLEKDDQTMEGAALPPDPEISLAARMSDGKMETLAECEDPYLDGSEAVVAVLPSRAPSAGAGPRKFAAASQALKMCNARQRPALHRRITAIRHAKAESSSLPRDDHANDMLPTYAQSLPNATHSVPSLDIVEAQSIPSGAEMQQSSSMPLMPARPKAQKKLKVSRKPLDSESLASEGLGHATKAAEDGRHQDMCAPAQVAAYRAIGGYPQARTKVPQQPHRIREQPCKTATAVGIQYSGSADRLGQYKNCADSQTTGKPRLDDVATIIEKAALEQSSTSDTKSTEQQILALLYLLRLPLLCIKATCTLEHFAAVPAAMRVIVSQEAKPPEMLSALRVLVVAFLRILPVLTMLFAMWKIQAAITELIQTVAWPILLFGRILALLMG